MTPLLFALAVLCGPGRAELAAPIEDVAEKYRLDPVALAVLVAAESTCHADARNRKTGTLGLLQIKADGSANPDHLPTTRLMDPAQNLDLGAAYLSRLLTLCGSMGAALTLYHGGGKRSADGRVRCQTDNHARKLLRRIRWLQHESKKCIRCQS